MSKFRYAVQYEAEDGTWKNLGGMSDVPKEFGLGFLLGRQSLYESPRQALRVVKYDNHNVPGTEQVIETLGAKTEVDIGQIAGFPSPQQYRNAAARAIAKAEQIERRLTKNDDLG